MNCLVIRLPVNSLYESSVSLHKYLITWMCMALALLNQLTGETKLASSTYLEPLKCLKALVHKVKVSYSIVVSQLSSKKDLQRKSVWLQSLGKSCWTVYESFTLFTIYWVRYEKKFWTAYLNGNYYFIYTEVDSKVTKRFGRIFYLEKTSRFN